MLLDDFSVIEYKDENISQDDLRTVLRMFADIVQEIIRPQSKKKNGILGKIFPKKENSKKEVNDQQRARESIEHDLYQQHEHLQDEELREFKEEFRREHIIHENKEEKTPETKQEVNVEPVAAEENVSPIENPQETNTAPIESTSETKEENNDDNKIMWTDDEVPEFNKVKEENAEVKTENPEKDLPTEKVEEEKNPEIVGEKTDLQTNIANETSWIADAPITGNNSQETKNDDEEDFPFQPLSPEQPAEKTNTAQANNPIEARQQETQENTSNDFSQEIPNTNSSETPKKEINEAGTQQIDDFGSVEGNNKEKTSNTLPSFGASPFNEEENIPVESIDDELKGMNNLDIGLGQKEENKAATDLKDLAEELKAVIKKEHLEAEYQETRALAVHADSIEELIETAERLIVEKNIQEAKNVYQEIMGKYNELDEEKKHQFFDKIQLLYNLLARK